MSRDESPAPARGQFLTTRWSMVRSAGDPDDPAYRDALAALCERYWYPVYAFVRRRGADPEEAQDLVQGFFAGLLEKDTLRDADPALGRFRSFLLSAVKFHLSDERRRHLAQKRGGGAEQLDLESAEERYLLEGDPADSPERLFERRWALELLHHARRRLEREVATSATPERVRLVPLLTAGGGPRYSALAEELGMSEGAVKVAVHRLRKRFGALLREEVAETVGEPALVDDELRHLLEVLG